MNQPRGYRADRGGMRYSEIEKSAWSARRVLASSVPADQPLSGLALFENLNSYTVQLATGRVVELSYGITAMPRGVEGETRYCPRTQKIFVELSEETYNALEQDEPRARYTIFHEVGHAVLHADQLVRVSKIPHGTYALARGMTPHKHFEDTEWQANAFSAALQMPARGLAHLVDGTGPHITERVARRFKVSHEAAMYRVDNFVKRRSELL